MKTSSDGAPRTARTAQGHKNLAARNSGGFACPRATSRRARAGHWQAAGLQAVMFSMAVQENTAAKEDWLN